MCCGPAERSHTFSQTAKRKRHSVSNGIGGILRKPDCLKPCCALAARVAAVVWARWLRGIIIDWRARAHDLRTGAAALGLPCTLAQASCALAAPDAAAA